MPLREKIATICKEIYGADGVDFSETAERRIEVHMISVFQCGKAMLLTPPCFWLISCVAQSYTSVGYGSLPICMAKTQYSLSTDAAAKGVPTGFRVLVRDVRAAVGAGYI